MLRASQGRTISFLWGRVEENKQMAIIFRISNILSTEKDISFALRKYVIPLAET